MDIKYRSYATIQKLHTQSI